MPHFSGMTYGRAKKENGRIRESRVMVMKDFVSRKVSMIFDIQQVHDFDSTEKLFMNLRFQLTCSKWCQEYGDEAQSKYCTIAVRTRYETFWFGRQILFQKMCIPINTQH